MFFLKTRLISYGLLASPGAETFVSQPRSSGSVYLGWFRHHDSYSKSLWRKSKGFLLLESAVGGTVEVYYLQQKAVERQAGVPTRKLSAMYCCGPGQQQNIFQPPKKGPLKKINVSLSVCYIQQQWSVTKYIYLRTVLKYKFEVPVLYLILFISHSTSTPLHFREKYCTLFTSLH